MTYIATRRQFVQTALLASAGSALGIPSRLLSASELHANIPVAVIFPDRRDPELLRRIAQRGIEAATSAGASFADIRVVERRLLSIGLTGTFVYGRMGFDYSYGMRVCVDGRWGSCYGVDPTFETVARIAEGAVKQVDRGTRVSFENARGPANATMMVGEWHTPIERDPFSVPSNDHVAMVAAHNNAISRVRGAHASIEFDWIGETRVVATSDGGLITQALTRATPKIGDAREISLRNVGSFRGGDIFWNRQVVLGAVSAGFEITEGAALQEQFKQFAEESVQLTRYPVAYNYPVGRYDVVFDGMTAAQLLGGTLVPALAGQRLTGQMGQYDLQSFLSPLRDNLSQPVASPLLSMSADRTLPQWGAAKWDDEAVLTRTFSLVDQGAIKGIFADRTTAPFFPSNVRDTIDIVPLPGCAVAPLPTRAPTASGSSVLVAPSETGGTLESLIGGMDNGIAVLGSLKLSTEPSLSHGLAIPMNCFEVKHGKIVRKISGAGIQFSTRKLWGNLEAIGGRASVQSNFAGNQVGSPPVYAETQVSAPAVVAREVGVVDMGGGR